jgi:hypothetical protein
LINPQQDEKKQPEQPGGPNQNQAALQARAQGLFTVMWWPGNEEKSEDDRPQAKSNWNRATTIPPARKCRTNVYIIGLKNG